MSVIAFTSTEPNLNIHIIADTMEKLYKWKLERQHKPACVHLTVMPNHAHTVDAFLAGTPSPPIPALHPYIRCID
jgi:hypothetical protein